MHNADLYQKNNSLQRRDALDCLEKYVSRIKWKKSNNRIIDIGCGDGSVTNMLKKYLPSDFKLLGCDISENMVNHANNHYCDEQTTYTVLDIAGDLPKGMNGSFDNAFSFYALHWIMEQERALTNVFDILGKGGECFFTVLVSHPIFEVYRTLARNKEWSEWLKDFEKYISPYHDSKDPAHDFSQLMEKVGFVNIAIESKDLVFMYDSMESMISAVTAFNPFKIPKDKRDAFLEDYLAALKEITRVDKSNSNQFLNIRFEYKMLVVFGQKPL